MVFSPRFTITNAIAAALTKIERAQGFIEAANLSEDWVANMQSQALVLEAHHTTRIEGGTLTLTQAQQLLGGQDVAGADPDDQRELLNYREAFELVAGYLGSGEPITEGLIREIHKRLVTGVRGDAAVPGAYRKIQNYVVSGRTGKTVYTPPPPDDVAPLMTELVAWLNADREESPILTAGISQFQLVHIHPFVDGNGRTARLLSTLCLYKTGYDFKKLFTISEYYDRDRAAYYDALRSVEQRDMDMTKWLEYFVEGLATQMQEVRERGEKTIRHDLFLGKAKEAGLKDRQLSLLAFILEQGRGSIGDCEKHVGGNRRTLQRDLKALVGKGFLREVASGSTDPTKYYEPLL